MRLDGGSEQDQLMLILFVCRNEDGTVATAPDGWLLSIGYRPLAKELFFVDPIRWCNGRGKAKYPETVKVPVLRAFSTKAYEYWETRSPGTWSLDQIYKMAEYFFGDPSHRVSHRNRRK
jgi:hypothetical protein